MSEKENEITLEETPEKTTEATEPVNRELCIEWRIYYHEEQIINQCLNWHWLSSFGFIINYILFIG